jgi:hypothetical protein
MADSSEDPIRTWKLGTKTAEERRGRQIRRIEEE